MPRCTATSKRSGTRCKRAVTPGWTVCYYHGARGGRPPVHGLRSTRHRNSPAFDTRVQELLDDPKLLQLRRDVAMGQATLEQVQFEISDDMAAAYVVANRGTVYLVAGGEREEVVPPAPSPGDLEVARAFLAGQLMRAVQRQAGIRRDAVKLEAFQAMLEQAALPLLDKLFQEFMSLAGRFVPEPLRADFELALRARMAALLAELEAAKAEV